MNNIINIDPPIFIELTNITKDIVTTEARDMILSIRGNITPLVAKFICEKSEIRWTMQNYAGSYISNYVVAIADTWPISVYATEVDIV